MRILGMSRRQLLRGSAAAGLSFLPLSGAVFREAWADTPGPRVLVTVYHPFGVVESAFYPQGSETSFTLGDGSRPLEAIKGDIIMFRNLDNLAGEHAKCGQGVDQHVAGVQTIWTGAGCKGGTGGGIRSLPTSPSIDQVAGEFLKTKFKTKLAAYNFGVRSTPDRYPANPDIAFTNCDAKLQIKKPTDDPLIAYTQLFAGGVTPTGPSVSPDEVAKRLAARRSLLDHVTAEANRFEQSLAGAERERFQSHVAAVRTFEKALSERVEEVAPAMSCTVPPKTMFQIASESPDVWKTAELQVKLMALTLSCGLTNVVTLNLTRGFVSYSVPNVLHKGAAQGPFDGHSLSHDGYGNSGQIKTNLNHMQSKTVVSLVEALKQSASPRGGTLFDETILLWSSCISGRGGGGHTRVKIPFVVAAGKRSGFVTGRNVDAAGRGQNPILLSTCQALGMDMQTFGDPRFCPGPMTALTTAGPMARATRPGTGYGCQGT